MHQCSKDVAPIKHGRLEDREVVAALARLPSVPSSSGTPFCETQAVHAGCAQSCVFLTAYKEGPDSADIYWTPSIIKWSLLETRCTSLQWYHQEAPSSRERTLNSTTTLTHALIPLPSPPHHQSLEPSRNCAHKVRPPQSQLPISTAHSMNNSRACTEAAPQAMI